MAMVLVGLLVGLIYVAQTIQVAAKNYEIDRLTAERDDLARQVQTLETNVLRWGTEATVLERAQRMGLDQVASRIRLPAR
jgi:cell division protein FtsB